MALATYQFAFGQAPQHSAPQQAAAAQTESAFIILVPGGGNMPPVQYEMVGATALTIAHTHYPSSYRRDYYDGSYGYGGGYGGRYRSFRRIKYDT